MAKRLSRIVETGGCWYARYRQRRHLLALDDRMLKDIGLTRALAQHEGNKPFWRQ
ncbi:DUF1127 domain-containing protein [Pontibacterium granulatum]|nr:DUF1127 domain-containing protein [Pontibacterium granulatum]MDI3325332.1 DUF1127 domain-containing protein [Pontibacterium granulatum]